MRVCRRFANLLLVLLLSHETLCDPLPKSPGSDPARPWANNPRWLTAVNIPRARNHKSVDDSPQAERVMGDELDLANDDFFALRSALEEAEDSLAASISSNGFGEAMFDKPDDKGEAIDGMLDLKVESSQPDFSEVREAATDFAVKNEDLANNKENSDDVIAELVKMTDSAEERGRRRQKKRRSIIPEDLAADAERVAAGSAGTPPDSMTYMNIPCALMTSFCGCPAMTLLDLGGVRSVIQQVVQQEYSGQVPNPAIPHAEKLRDYVRRCHCCTTLGDMVAQLQKVVARH